MREAGELLSSPDGTLWHLAHVPLYWKDGTLAKQGWDFDKCDQLKEILLLRLIKTGESEIELDRDGRAQFSGIVLSKGISLRKPTVSTEYHNEIHRKLGSYFREENPLRLVCKQSWLESLKAPNSVFAEEVDFSDSFFSGNVSFSGASFKNEALFKSVIFNAETNFCQAHFYGDTAFERIVQFGLMDFENCGFNKNTNFNRAKFQKISFLGAEFKEKADFLGSDFSDANTFMNTRFHQRATFECTSFANVADFTSASFVDSGSFRKVLFKQGAQFRNIKEWGEASSRWSRAFFAAKASGMISFEGGSMPPLSAFDGLHIESGASLVLDDAGYKKMTKAFFKELAEIRTKFATESSENDAVGKPNSALYSNLASGCRFLKKYFDSIGDKDLFQRFARFELEARMKSDEVGRLERLIFWAYEWLSDYGGSIGRPLRGLGYAFLGFGFFYWASAALCLTPEITFDWKVFIGSFDFSLRHTFPFVTPDMKAENADFNMRKKLLGDGDSLENLLLRCVTIVQTTFSLAMIFLSGLAIRRRFKMD